MSNRISYGDSLLQQIKVQLEINKTKPVATPVIPPATQPLPQASEPDRKLEQEQALSRELTTLISQFTDAADRLARLRIDDLEKLVQDSASGSLTRGISRSEAAAMNSKISAAERELAGVQHQAAESTFKSAEYHGILQNFNSMSSTL